MIDDWRADGYRWFQCGTKCIPRSKPEYKKIHFVLVLPTGHNRSFIRHAYILINDPNSVLIHYIGDESIALDFPHDNTKKDHNFHRTCPSVLRQLSSTNDLPANVYKNKISGSKYPPENQPACLPRNSQQILNLQKNERKKSRLTHDAIYKAVSV